MFRIGSPGARLCLYVFLAFFAVGLVLVLLGFDLDEVDLWLDGNADMFDAVGSKIFRVLCGAVFVVCVIVVGGGLWQAFVGPRSRMGDAADYVTETTDGGDVEEAKPAGWGCMLLAVIVGYFAWFGMTG